MTDHQHVGYLTWEEFVRFGRAVHNSQKVVPWFRVAGYIKGAQEEVRAPSSNHPLGIPPTWLAAEEITRLSRELRYWANLEDVANDDIGAMTARDFTREVETAMARWPIEDKPHRVEHVRCQVCVGETIRWSPPQFDGDRTRIVCTECGHRVTDDELEVMMAIRRTEMEKIKKEQKKAGKTKRVA